MRLPVILAVILVFSAPAFGSQFTYWENLGDKAGDPRQEVVYYVNAVKAWERSDSREDLARIYRILGSVYIRLKRPDYAIDSIDMALKLSRENLGMAHNIRGVAYLTRHRYEKALSDFIQALPTEEDPAVTHANLCMGYTGMEGYSTALGHCEKAIKLKPSQLEGFTARGLVYAELGDTGRALADLKKVLAAAGDTTTVLNVKDHGSSYKGMLYSHIGYAHFKGGDYTAAEENYNTAAKLSPALAQNYWRRGRLRAAAGNKKKALEDYSLALGLDPECVEAYNWRGQLYLEEKSYALALKDFNKALSISKPPSLLLHRGLCYLGLGKYKAALADLDKFISKKPRVAPAYAARAEALEAAGEPELAKSDRQAACRFGHKRSCGGKN